MVEMVVYAFLGGFILGGGVACFFGREYITHIRGLQDKVGELLHTNAELKNKLNVAEKRLKHYMGKCEWLEKRQ